MNTKAFYTVCFLILSSPAQAGFDADLSPLIQPEGITTAGVRLSMDQNLGFGVGLHGSLWVVGIASGITVGGGWYQRGKRLFAGVQAGAVAGVGLGLFTQTGRNAGTGSYYDVWGFYPEPLLDFGSGRDGIAAGVSFRHYRQPEHKLFELPNDISLLSVLVNEIL